MTTNELAVWLRSLGEDRYPEDGLQEGDPDAVVRGVLCCWWSSRAAREAARAMGANVIVAHEAAYFDVPQQDPGCPEPDTWPVNEQAREFYRTTGTAFIRAHRCLDAWGVGEAFADYLGFPPPAVREGYRGYHFTLVYDLPPSTFAQLTERLKRRMKRAVVRTSLADPGRVVCRVGLGWGGIPLSSNLAYVEPLRRHGAEVIVGGEVDEFTMEYCREAGLEWIELGHYASEIVGVRRLARDLAARLPGVPVRCHEEQEDRVRFCCIPPSADNVQDREDNPLLRASHSVR